MKYQVNLNNYEKSIWYLRARVICVCKSFLVKGLQAITEIVGSCFLEDSVSIKSDIHKVNVAARMAEKQDLGYTAIIWIEKLMEIISFSRL